MIYEIERHQIDLARTVCNLMLIVQNVRMYFTNLNSFIQRQRPSAIKQLKTKLLKSLKLSQTGKNASNDNAQKNFSF